MLALLSLVLLFRTLIPAGYMIAPTGGWPMLTLCEAPALPASPHHDGHEEPTAPKQPCAYAALAAPTLPPAPPLVASPLSPPEPATAVRTAQAPARRGSAALPPPSTGPPRLV